MTMTLNQQIITILMVVLGTVLTRCIPFILFPASKPTPKFVVYLGKVLPSAVLGMLVVYSLKDVNIFSTNHGIPEIIASLTVVVLHFWKRNMLVSIAGGTVFYMVLVQFIF